MSALLPAVSLLKDFFDYSKELETILPRLLEILMQNDPTKQNLALNTQQALTKQLADIFDFALQFDDAKMLNPGIQNDFSYYRRSLARLLLNKESAENIIVKDELANRMSLFFASPTPMMKVLTDTTNNFVEGNNSNVTRDELINGLALMANVCYEMVAKKKFTSVKTNMFCLRAMTTCIIIVDHVSRLGAFYKKSPINVRFYEFYFC